MIVINNPCQIKGKRYFNPTQKVHVASHIVVPGYAEHYPKYLNRENACVASFALFVYPSTAYRSKDTRNQSTEKD